MNKVTYNLSAYIDKVIEEKGLEKFTMDGKEVRISIKLYQHYQINVYLDAVAKKKGKYVHVIQSDNKEASSSNLRINLTMNGQIRSLYEQFSLTANYLKVKE